MEFIAYDRDKRPMMRTSHIEALPDEDTINSMMSVGYTFKIDGKRVDKSTILKLSASADKQTRTTDAKIQPLPDFPITSRTVICIETGIYYKTQKEAAEQLNIDFYELNSAINKGISVNGYTFKKVK